MATPICRPCLGIGCDNPDDLSAGIDGALYSALDYSFIVQCPDGCFCPAGLFPMTVSILASTIPPVIPPILEPGEQIILRLQGCTSLITRTLAAGSTQAQIAAAAQSMQAEWAGQQSLCIARATPGVSCSTSITICNDPHTFICYTGATIVVPAGTYCQTLVTTGLTAQQIADQSAAIKANLNQLADDSFCPFHKIICQIQDQSTPGAVNVINIWFKNVGGNTVDISSFVFCIVATCPPFPPAFTTIGPNSGFLLWNGAFNGAPNPFSVQKDGVPIYTHAAAPLQTIDVFITVGCTPT